MHWAELPRALMSWVQTVGGVAAVGALIWFNASLAGRRLEKQRFAATKLGLVTLFASWAGFATVLLLFMVNWLRDDALAEWMPTTTYPVRPGELPPPPPPPSVADWLLTISGALALVTVAAPMLVAIVTRVRWGRIWALARLSFKEAVRSKAVLVFGAMIPVFLFAAWFIPYKPENQVRNYVFLLYLCIVILFFMSSSLLGSLGIPADVKSQAIHTIVTKPVEKLEIVFGRFLGYALVITVGLAAVTGMSMIYMVRDVSEEAKAESYKARVPVYGALGFVGTKGENVGRQYDVRSYITGIHPNQPDQPRQFAVWNFDALPGSLGSAGEPVRIEFGFDIFRLTKGIENQGVLCTFIFADGRLPVTDRDFQRIRESMKNELDQKREAARKQAGGNDAELKTAEEAVQRELIEKYGFAMTESFNVTDYHTQFIDVPAALFQHLYKLEETSPRLAKDAGTRPPMFQIAVSVDYDLRGQNQQMLGVARPDLYLLAAENSFLINFVKGIVGLWCLMMLVLGIAVACSTYLSGVISWLCTCFLLIAGLFVTDIQELAQNRSVGGGPLESAYRLLSKTPQAGQLDEGPTASVLTGVDEVYRWWLRMFLNLVPDVNRFDLHQYVANGFDVSWGRLLLLNNLLPLLGYLLPCAVLAFYLMKYREIANPT